MASLAEIIGAVMDNDGTANDALSTNQLNQLILNSALSIALTISLEVAQVTDVAVLVSGSTMFLVRWVEVRASGRAPIGVVAKGVDVHSTLSVGVVAGDVVGDGRWAALRVLLEGDGALDLGVSTEDCD
jgi:hypothetical protein